MSRRSLAVPAILTALALVPALVERASAVDPVVTQKAVAYLRGQQNPGTTPSTGGGAWDSDPSLEFVTSEALLAVAEQARRLVEHCPGIDRGAAGTEPPG